MKLFLSVSQASSLCLLLLMECGVTRAWILLAQEVRRRPASAKKQRDASFSHRRLPRDIISRSHLGSHFTSPVENAGPTSTNSFADFPNDLFERASNITTVLRDAVTGGHSHDPFRYEWGTWVNMEQLEHLMDALNQIQAKSGLYDIVKESHDHKNRRIRVAGNKDWDCFLHVLPKGTDWKGRWPAGSWAIVKPLTGVTEVAQLRDDEETVRTSKDLRGGSDGSFGGGFAPGSGENCTKYVGGPVRRYAGKSGTSVILEMVLRPPVGDSGMYRKYEKEPLKCDVRDIMEMIPPAPVKDSDAEINELENGKTPMDGVFNQNVGGSKGNTTAQQKLGTALGMEFSEVGGLSEQLEAIARRVLASRANPQAAKRLGVGHVRGILLSGPPGCGKTLLARELARLLGAREPQIVNGPEILDKFIGEAEKKLRALFEPAEREYAAVGDASALHIIILDEMDAIAKKRGSASSDTTGVRDSVVNQLLAKMDGVNQVNNILVVGLTNRPELLDPALLRPGRLEVQLRVELPDLIGRRDILRIHTRQMQIEGALAPEAFECLEDLGATGMPAKCDYFTGAELAGLVRSAASFALARSVQNQGIGTVTLEDLQESLNEIRPALGRQDDLLKMRYPLGISSYSSSVQRILRDLDRFNTPIMNATSPRQHSLLLVGSGGSGAGTTALAAHAAAQASQKGIFDFVRFITYLDLLDGEGAGGDAARAAALMERFDEARQLPTSLLVLDDIDQICAGTGTNGQSNIMIAALRALLRNPPESDSVARAGGQSKSKNGSRSMNVIAVTSRSDAACGSLVDLFDETLVVPQVSKREDLQKLLYDSLDSVPDELAGEMAGLILDRLDAIGCKTALRLVERAMAFAGLSNASTPDALIDKDTLKSSQLSELESMLDDLVGEQAAASNLCQLS